jgi:hypothetical protein
MEAFETPKPRLIPAPCRVLREASYDATFTVDTCALVVGIGVNLSQN